ncbi:MAG: TetR/AcrR family transcriptional regulator [Candidatus Methylomirabilia bacterium]
MAVGRVAPGKPEKHGAADAPDRSARERLLREAADIFSRKGYAATSVAEIVAAAGVTKPVLYYHFKSKEGLYLELMEDGLGKFQATIEAALGSDKGTAADRIRRLCETLIGLALENLSTSRLTRGIRFAQPQGAPVFDVGEFPRAIQKTLQRLVEQGVRTGEFKPVSPADLVWVIMGLLAACIDTNLVDPALALKPRGFRSALNLVFAGVTPAKRR